MADNNNPFMPVKFPKGPPTTMVWEDGPGIYVNPSNTGVPVVYGIRQTALINTANPKPPRQTLPAAAGTDSKLK
jgi:hypothetical protein